MAITWADILTWTTGPLESAATDLAATSKALVSAASDGQDAVAGIQSQGSAVTAIRTAASTNMTSLTQLATNVNSALMAIEGAYDGVAKVMANVQNAQAYAAENYCTIGSDGKSPTTPTRNIRKMGSSLPKTFGRRSNRSSRTLT